MFMIGYSQVFEGTAEVNEDEAGPSRTLSRLFLNDLHVQEDTLIAVYQGLISQDQRGAKNYIPGIFPSKEIPESPTLKNLDSKDKAAETANDEEVARKVAAEWEEEEERKRLAGLERPTSSIRIMNLVC
ncbi:hypothetical protein Tco_0560950 [Tanacetum coccineum]